MLCVFFAVLCAWFVWWCSCSFLACYASFAPYCFLLSVLLVGICVSTLFVWVFVILPLCCVVYVVALVFLCYDWRGFASADSCLPFVFCFASDLVWLWCVSCGTDDCTGYFLLPTAYLRFFASLVAYVCVSLFSLLLLALS